MHARRKYGRHYLYADMVRRLGENAHRVAQGGGVGVLKGGGEDDALAGKDGFVV